MFICNGYRHHAKRIIEALYEQKRFEKNLIALHIKCEKVWPNDWSPIRPERTHRPSVLCISDADDDDKALWIVEATKALLPQEEGSYDNGLTISTRPSNIFTGSGKK